MSERHSRLTYQVTDAYSRFAPHYDATLGIPFFVRTRRAFETIVERHGVTFASAADLGCGTGLFAAYLSRCWGVPVFAVDRCPQMLRIAARHCRGLDVRLLRQDIRRLRLPCPVDLITANFDTLNHLTGAGELPRTLRRIRASLRPGGHLFFDVITACRPLGGARHVVLRFGTTGPSLVQRIRWDPRCALLSSLVIVRSPCGGRPAVEVHGERAFAPATISRWLKEAGLVVRAVYDSATLRPPLTCPPRILLLVQRPR